MTAVVDGARRWVYDRKNVNIEWNVAMPWKGKTQSPHGAVRGGGKGKPKFFYTPVKARTVICEIYGKNMNPDENLPWISDLALALPGDCIVVTPKILQTLLREEWLIEELNQNPYSFREILFKNMNGFASSHATKTDFLYYGKYY